MVFELIPFLLDSVLTLFCHRPLIPLSLIKDLANPKTRTDTRIVAGTVKVFGTKRYESMKYTDIPESTDPGNKER